MHDLVFVAAQDHSNLWRFLGAFVRLTHAERFALQQLQEDEFVSAVAVCWSTAGTRATGVDVYERNQYVTGTYVRHSQTISPSR